MSEPATKRTSSTRKGVRHRRPRKRLSCEPCRNAKLRCDRQQPCTACKRRDCEAACAFWATRQAPTVTAPEIIAVDPSRPCQHTRVSPSALPHPEAEAEAAPSTAALSTATSAGTAPPHRHYHHCIPPLRQGEQQQHHPTIAPLDAVLERPAFGQDEFAPGPGSTPMAPFTLGPRVPTSELLRMLPSNTLCEYLISRYFTYQAPLFPVLHGPTFQKQYNKFVREPEQISQPWLPLLFIVCSSAMHTLDIDDPALDDDWSTNPEIPSRDPLLLSRHLRCAGLTCLSEARFMVRYDLNTLEALLIMIYEICHSEGVDRSWVFLGVALNIGIALRCNVNVRNLDSIEIERRWRCWTGIRLLHTYQGLLFRDIDMSFLLSVSATMPADMSDPGTGEDGITDPSSRLAGMSLMRFKIRLFELSTRICSHLSDGSIFDESSMNYFDSLIASERQQWDSLFLLDGSPSLLDTASYAYWCILQTYAYQLYLLIHRYYRRYRGCRGEEARFFTWSI